MNHGLMIAGVGSKSVPHQASGQMLIVAVDSAKAPNPFDPG